MNCLKSSCAVVLGFTCLTGCGSSDDTPITPTPVVSSTVLDLDDVTSNTGAYDWFDFKPGIQKLILAGTADAKHIAILWYTEQDGGVALHYHSQTESVYVIDGTQTDAKGTYPTGTVYFNPPGSGHQVTDSTGFFLLAYAAPPDFASTDLIGEYTPIRIDTADLAGYEFDERQTGVKTFSPPLDSEGGLSAAFIETTSASAFTYTGNYLLVIQGSCKIDGAAYGEKQLLVAKAVTPLAYEISTPKDASCLALGVSF
ncbi:MAG: cupin domain-containing protein [Polyangiaceae bacterium]